MDSASGSSSAPFSLLETMRLEGGRLLRRERHLARIQAAARDFGYHWQEAAVQEALRSTTAAHPAGCWRVRLLVAPDGSPTIECTPHEDDRRVWRVALALEPIDPKDPFILHKTTRRVVYDAARRSRPDVDDVLLWNGKGEITEFTIGNLVADIDGRRVTPPVESGLLEGVFRAELLAAGTIHERVLTKADIARATHLWLVNSLRGWVDVEVERQDRVRDSGSG
jgi:para-aminobenzoate synthetase/4-amino-4-deoxychorismate lyase